MFDMRLRLNINSNFLHSFGDNENWQLSWSILNLFLNYWSNNKILVQD